MTLREDVLTALSAEPEEPEYLIFPLTYGEELDPALLDQIVATAVDEGFCIDDPEHKDRLAVSLRQCTIGLSPADFACRLVVLTDPLRRPTCADLGFAPRGGLPDPTGSNWKLLQQEKAGVTVDRWLNATWVGDESEAIFAASLVTIAPRQLPHIGDVEVVVALQGTDLDGLGQALAALDAFVLGDGLADSLDLRG